MKTAISILSALLSTGCVASAYPYRKPVKYIKQDIREMEKASRDVVFPASK